MNFYNRLIFTLLLAVLNISAAVCRPLAIAACGDSNTWLGGDDCSGPAGWTFYLKERLGYAAVVKSFARSGATWSHSAKTTTDLDEYSEVITDNNVVSNQLERLISDVSSGAFPAPDIIFFAAGTNDAWFEKRFRPGCLDASSPAGTKSLRGAAADVLLKAKSRFPDSKLILLTPMQTIQAPDDVIKKAAEELAAAAEGLEDVYVVRIDLKSPVRSENERVHFDYTTDGTHTSARGAKANALIIIESMIENSLINRY